MFKSVHFLHEWIVNSGFNQLEFHGSVYNLIDSEFQTNIQHYINSDISNKFVGRYKFLDAYIGIIPVIHEYKNRKLDVVTNALLYNLYFHTNTTPILSFEDMLKTQLELIPQIEPSLKWFH